MTIKNTFATLLISIVLLSCNEKDTHNSATTEQATAKVITSEKEKFVVDTLTKDLVNPWGIAFLPDGRMLVTERAGKILIFKDDKLQTEQVEGVPPVYVNGQGGLLDIKLHPDYATNGWIYLSYAKPGEGGGGTTIIRAKLNGNKLVDLQELFTAMPYADKGQHFGSRIVFDGKGYMFFSSGERGTKENAQNLGNHLGKILRLHDDGRVPADNPFVNKKGAKPEIWSYGNRNPQGLVYDRDSDILWEVEHGPKGGDELNIIEKGKNYGWPVITYGINYDGTPITDKTSMEGMEQPITYWLPSIGTCGMTQIKGDKFPAWKNNLMVGGLALKHVARVQVDGRKYVGQEKLFDQTARVRYIAESPEGFIYVAMEGPGLLLKLSPAKG